MMDSFFDTNVVINYASFSKHVFYRINQLCHDYILSKKGRYILCHYVREEIDNRIKKRKIIHQEAIRKLKDRDYEIGSSSIGKSLSERDIINAKKLYGVHSSKTANEVSAILLSERIEFEKKIEFFLKTLVDEVTLKKEEIDRSLVNLLYGIIEEYADCRVLASALQIQKDRAIFFLVTADKEHFNPNYYNFIKTDPRMEKLKFPELRNLLFNRK